MMPFDQPAAVVSTPPNRTGTYALYCALLLLVGWTLIGIPIALLPPEKLNPDTYQYLSIANYYLESAGWHIRDATTVGPVIPGLLAIVKWIALHIVTWTPDVDLAIVKCSAFACYLVITIAAVTSYARKGIARHASALVVALLLFTIPFETDMLSLNGELVCVTWLAWIFLLASKPTPNRFDDAVIILLAVFVLYTKVQAALMLAATLLTCFEGRRQLKLLVGAALAFAVIDTVMFFQGAGVMAGLTRVTTYVHGAYAAALYPVGSWQWLYTSIARPLSQLKWVLSSTFTFFPIGASLILAALLSETKASTRKSLLLWVVVFLASVMLPGRPFGHYLLCLIPLVFLFAGVGLDATRVTVPRPSLAIAFVVILAAARFCSLVPTAQFFGHDRSFFVVPRQFISAAATKFREARPISSGDTLVVHGSDFRYYSYFDKGGALLDLAAVENGSETRARYLQDLLDASPAYILDIVNHSGAIRDPALALAADPAWKAQIVAAYDQVFSQDGFVVYHRRGTAPMTKS